MELIELEDHFNTAGGQFISSAYTMQEKLQKIKAYIFDWDGVFNDGFKLSTQGSGFSEVDSAGVRLLRYAHYQARKSNSILAIITGAENPTAKWFIKKQNGNALYQKAINKNVAFKHFCTKNELLPEEVAFIYDDVIDIEIAQQCGLSFCIGRLANPLFLNFVENNSLADYITASQGNEHGVREVCELLVGLYGSYDECLKNVINREDSYREHKEKLKVFAPEFFFIDGTDVIIA
ncbi:MAG: 3-deoxy-D-manno-octulosonate 8-phosphate phosphatase (KDO 8-P phosphatase) [Arcticibacterium sp.]|jgi:3-deoxy-D-manno-octulosonate 8-phosphate phosphatase (KDO 8-P phosphatase)